MKIPYILPLIYILLRSSGPLLASKILEQPNEVLLTIIQNHPVVKTNQFKKNIGEKTVEMIQKRPNLELEGEILQNPSRSQSQSMNLSLTFAIDLGGMRGAQVDMAKEQNQIDQLDGKIKLENIKIEVITNLHRLRQIHKLVELHQESITAFDNILSTFKKRPSLSPEQQVEKETIELAASDYRLKLSQLQGERSFLLRHLNYFLGQDYQMHPNAFPQILNLTDPTELKSNKALNSLQHQKVKANLSLANKQHQYQKAKSIPQLKIGPMWEYEKDLNVSDHKIGLTFTMDLPVFNTNREGRQMAQENINLSRHQSQNFQTDQELDFTSSMEQYQRYYTLLQKTSSHHFLEKKHLKVESLFRRGVISTSLVIETHRQLIEFTHTKFDFEIQAIKALTAIYQQRGQLDHLNLL